MFDDGVPGNTNIADSPCNCAFLACVLTKVHDVVSANCAVVDDNVPGPECNSVPLARLTVSLRWTDGLSAHLLHLELLLCLDRLASVVAFGPSWGIGHLNVVLRFGLFVGWLRNLDNGQQGPSEESGPVRQAPYASRTVKRSPEWCGSTYQRQGREREGLTTAILGPESTRTFVWWVRNRYLLERCVD
ncbi:hypothetical protein LIA77_09550 [Sarocladium implicatum]|nr:hypothetical protein LIA77_09550 [Sarocladium implicatum]